MGLRSIALAFCAGVAALSVSLVSAIAAPDRVPVSIDFSRVGTDLHAVFKTARPVDKLLFAYNAVADRDDTWVVVTPGFKMVGNVIAAAGNASFDHFEIVIHPGVETSQIAYPTVTQLTPDSIVVYPGYFIPRRELFDTTLKFNVSGGDVVAGLPNNAPTWNVPPAFPPSTVSASRYVYLGPRAQIPDSVGTFVFAAGYPEWMKSEVVRTLHAVIPFYERMLGRKLPAPAQAYAVLFPKDAADTASFRADVTDDYMVLLRFWGPVWQQPAPEQLGLIHEIVSHEAFHFWNGSLYFPSEGEVNPWLHEGSATYMSWVAQSELFGVNPEARRQHMENGLNSCVEALGASYLVGALHAHGWGSATYDCGEVAQWLSDVGIRKSSNGSQNIFTIWQKMFQAAEQHQGAYSTADFLGMIRTFDPATRNALGMFLVQDGRERWAKLPEALAPLGIKVSQAPAPERRLRETMMWHLLRTNCEAGYYGFWIKEGGMTLRTGQGCGTLAGDPTIVSVEGHDIFTDTRAAYAAEHDRCAAGGVLRLGKKDGNALFVRCGEPMEEPLPSFKVESDGLAKVR